MRKLGLLTLALCCAQVGSAQMLSTHEFYSTGNSFDLADMGYPGVQGRVVHGDPIGDRTGAMFFLVQGEVLWSPTPYALTSVAPIASTPTAAGDLAVLPESTGDRDMLVMSTSLGLARTEYDPANNSFQVLALASSGSWQGANQLKRRELGAGQTVLSGLLTDGSTVQVAHVDELAVTDLFSVTFPLPVMEHDLIDYDGDGLTDVAVVNSYGLFVFSQGGSLLRREEVAIQVGGVVTFESQGVARLAFWYQDPVSSLAFLRVIDGPSTEAEVPLRVYPPGGSSLLDVVPSYAVRGDYNDDGDQDLLLQIHHLFCVLLLNQAPDSGPPPTAHFSTADDSYDAIPLGFNPSQPTDPGQAQAWFGDIDSTRGDDLIVPLEALDHIELSTRRGVLDPGGPGPSPDVGLTSGDFVQPNTTYLWREGEPGSETAAYLNLALEVPADFLPGGMENFNALQVVTFFEAGGTQQLTLLARENNFYDLIVDEVHQYVRIRPLDPNWMLLEDYVWPDMDNIWVLFRFVHTDTSQMPPHIDHASRFMIGAYTLENEIGEVAVYLLGLPGADPEAVFFDSGEYPVASTGNPLMGSGTVSSQGNAYVGGYVGQSFSVIFPPGDAPMLPPATHPGSTTDY